MGEPLKDKIQKEVQLEMKDGSKKFKKTDAPYFDYDDIKSAVEWLKETIKKNQIDEIYINDELSLSEVIEQSFPDIILEDAIKRTKEE